MDKNKLMLFQELFVIVYITMLFAIEILNIYSVVFLGFLAVVSVIYVAMEFCNERSVLKTYKIDWLILFVVINVLSIAVNFKYGFFDNILCLFTFFVDYLILYNVYGGRSEEQVQHYFKLVTHFFLLLYTCAILFSLLGYFMQHSHVFYIEDRMFRHGFIESRLFGIFPDPNYASLVALVMVMMCVYYIIKSDAKYKKVVYGIGALLNFSYMILSGSRTAMLSMTAAILVGGYFAAFRKIRDKGWGALKRQTVCMFTAVIITAVCLGAAELFRIGLSYAPSGISIVSGEGKKEAVSLIREDVEESEDYSNNRIKIWKSAFRIFKEKPLIGTSPRNLVSYAKEVFPASYIAISQYMVHNSIFETMVFSGLLGITAMMIFIFCCAYRTFEHLYKKTDEHFAEVLLGTMVIVAMLVSSLTLSALFYNRGSYNTLFWFFMGFLTYYVSGCTKGDGKLLALADRLFKRR